MGDQRRATLLEERSEFGIERITSDVVRTKFVYDVIEKIMNVAGWITITGNPGDGKTTAGFMVLKEMVKRGRHVFHVKEPEEYYAIAKRDIFGDIIMLDDVLGTFSFDPSIVSQWEPVIKDLTRRTDRSNENSHYLSVLFISRWDVLYGGMSMLGDYEDHIMDKKTITFMSSVNESVIYDRLEILDYHLKRADITDVAQKDKEELASDMVLYGFPLCSKMYADMRGKGQDTPIKEFFSSPMKILDEKIKGLIEDKGTEDLFKLLLQNDGELDLNSIETESIRNQLTSAASSLTGSLLIENNGRIMFSHPTMHESVAYCIGKKDEDFAINQLSISFLIQRAKFLGFAPRSDDVLFVTPSESNIERLCQRFHSLLLKRDFAVLQHNFFENRDFCQKLFSSLSSKAKTWRNKLFFWKREMDKLHIDDTDANGDTLLHVAARLSRVTAVDVLLEHGADVNKPNKQGLTPFHCVCQNHTFDDNLIDLMIKKGADVNKTTKNGCNSLHFLCEHARQSTIKMVIEYGARVDKPCNLYHLWKKENRHSLQPTRIKSRIPFWTAYKYGLTPLHNLCRKNLFIDADLLTLMIKHGADVKKSDLAGWTPLHCLSLNEKADRSTFEVMIKHGAEVNEVSVRGITPLHFLCQTVRDGDNKLNVLLEHGAEVRRVDDTGMSALHDLCMNENVHGNTLSLLFEHGADANKATVQGMNPLHLLCQTNHVDQSTMDTLITNTDDINLEDRSEMTPLHYLCQNTKADGNALGSLLMHEATVAFGTTPLHTACRSKIPNSDNIDLLSKVVADVDTVDYDGWTPFHLLCAFCGDDKSVDIMIKHGADVNKEDKVGFTSVHHLCKGNGINARSLDMIMSQGADINKLDVSGWSPLHRQCAGNGDARSIDIMIRRGADVNQASQAGDTPLNLLMSLSPNDRSVEVMIKHGADVNIANNDGETPLDKLRWKLDESTIDMMTKLASNANEKDETENAGTSQETDNGKPEDVPSADEKDAIEIAGTSLELDHGKPGDASNDDEKGAVDNAGTSQELDHGKPEDASNDDEKGAVDTAGTSQELDHDKPVDASNDDEKGAVDNAGTSQELDHDKPVVASNDDVKSAIGNAGTSQELDHGKPEDASNDDEKGAIDNAGTSQEPDDGKPEEKSVRDEISSIPDQTTVAMEKEGQGDVDTTHTQQDSSGQNKKDDDTSVNIAMTFDGPDNDNTNGYKSITPNRLKTEITEITTLDEQIDEETDISKEESHLQSETVHPTPIILITTDDNTGDKDDNPRCQIEDTDQSPDIQNESDADKANESGMAPVTGDVDDVDKASEHEAAFDIAERIVNSVFESTYQTEKAHEGSDSLVSEDKDGTDKANEDGTLAPMMQESLEISKLQSAEETGQNDILPTDLETDIDKLDTEEIEPFESRVQDDEPDKRNVTLVTEL